MHRRARAAAASRDSSPSPRPSRGRSPRRASAARGRTGGTAAPRRRRSGPTPGRIRGPAEEGDSGKPAASTAAHVADASADRRRRCDSPLARRIPRSRRSARSAPARGRSRAPACSSVSSTVGGGNSSSMKPNASRPSPVARPGSRPANARARASARRSAPGADRPPASRHPGTAGSVPSRPTDAASPADTPTRRATRLR